MKTLFKTFGILALVLSLNSCKKNDKNTEQQKSAETTSTLQKTDKIPNYTPPSDKLFARAIKDFDDDYMEGATSVIDEAILAIEYEGAGLKGSQKNAFKNAIDELKTLNTKIKDEKHVTKEQLLQGIANVRYPLYQPTYQAATTIVIAKPEELHQIKLNRAFDESNALFKSEKKEYNEVVKKDKEALKKEGEEIQKLKEDLQSKMKNHLKKTQEFNKKNNPENYDESYLILLDD